MSPSPLVDSLPHSDNQQVDIISLLIAALEVFPDSHPIDGPGQPVDWLDLVVGEQYWGQVTGFGSDGSTPRRFTVTQISQFPDGGAMIWTDEAAWAWGVGGTCESLIGPRNRFWRV
jgi:hypothetical protein